MRPHPALAALILAGCGSQAPEPAKPARQAAESRPAEPAAPPAAAAKRGAPARTNGGAEGAADVLKAYYAHIEARDYDRAFALRRPSPRGPSREQFAASFARYAEHRATVGQPSLTAEANGSVYVEVPVQIVGRLTSGKPFGTAGTVTLRRPAADPGGWRIGA